MLSQWNSTSHVQTARFHKSALHTINRWYHMAAYADTGTVFARFLKFLILCGVYVSPAIVGEALFLVAYVSARRLTLAAYSAAGNVQTAPSSTNAYTQQLHHTSQNCVYQSPPALDVISCVQQHLLVPRTSTSTYGQGRRKLSGRYGGRHTNPER